MYIQESLVDPENRKKYPHILDAVSAWGFLCKGPCALDNPVFVWSPEYTEIEPVDVPATIKSLAGNVPAKYSYQNRELWRSEKGWVDAESAFVILSIKES